VYEIVRLPVAVEAGFENMSKAELDGYMDWFLKAIPARVEELARAVRSDGNYRDWCADESPESLMALGRWFDGQVETRKTTKAEMEEERKALVIPIAPSTAVLTAKTISICLDIGIYFARVVMATRQDTHWEQPRRSKRFVDYGQPVIMGLGVVPLNPVRIATSTAWGISRGKSADLKRVYDYWVGSRT
jgi:hypothetical protein